jgi:hypothetical protein
MTASGQQRRVASMSSESATLATLASTHDTANLEGHDCIIGAAK